MHTATHARYWQQRLDETRQHISQLPRYHASGRITRATGMVLEATGLRIPLGGGCRIELSTAGTNSTRRFAEAEVVGFSGDKLFLMPLEELSGLQPDARVLPLGEGKLGHLSARRFPLGESMLGRVVDGSGEPLDGKGPLTDAHYATLHTRRSTPSTARPLIRKLMSAFALSTVY